MKCNCRAHSGFLTAIGLAEAAQRDVGFGDQLAMGLTGDEEAVRLDKSGSVSGSFPIELHWDDGLIEEQYRRFHNGS